jgi:elongation factor G
MKYARQTGGRGQYGHVRVFVEPAPIGSGVTIESWIVGGAIANEFLPAIEEGLREAAASGEPLGYAIDDVRITLLDGSYHDVDSTPAAFRIAAAGAFQDAVRRAGPSVDSVDGSEESFVAEPRRPRPAPRDTVVAVPEPDDDVG